MQTSEDFPQVTQIANETRELCNSIQYIDCVSQEGLSQIEAIASLLESRIELGIKGEHIHLAEIYHSIGAIKLKAQEIRNDIKQQATSVGCAFTDKLNEIRN